MTNQLTVDQLIKQVEQWSKDKICMYQKQQ